MDITVDGIPFELLANTQGYYIRAEQQNVAINGSPIIISFDPPIAPTIDLGEVYQVIKAKL